MSACLPTRFEPMHLALTAEEAEHWRLFVGVRAPLPRSAEELAARIERQARELEAGGSPDERLAAMMAREFARAALAVRRAAGRAAAEFVRVA